MDTVVAPLRIYVAGPLTAADGDQHGKFVRQADAAAKDLHAMGHYPHCPHTQSQTWHHDPRPCFHDYSLIVEGLDFAWLRVCDAVLLLPGWEDSRGAKMEEAEAKRLGIRIFHSIAEVPSIRTDDDALKQQWMLEQRDHFSRVCRQRLIAGDAKYGTDWTTKDNIEEAVAECYDLENYPFLHACKLRARFTEDPTDGSDQG